MQTISPNTLFTGKHIVFLPECTSTNTVAHDLLSKNKATEGSTVITASQVSGRGQRGNSWEAEPDKNITLSVILSPGFLPVSQQFYLNMAVSLAVLDFVAVFVSGACTVKWPNDVYVQDKKLGGILIENTISGNIIQHAVIGIGLNINQLKFKNERAVSLATITGKTYQLPVVTEQLLEKLECRYLELRAGKQAKLKYEYLQHLFRYQVPARFKTDNAEVSGQIVGVDENGRLAVEINNTLQVFNFKEIEFLF